MSDFELAVQRSLEEHQELRHERKRVRRAIQRQLPQDLYVKSVPPDGNCLFHALSAGLAAGHAIQRTHRALRLECVQAIPRTDALRGRFMFDADLHKYVTDLAQDGVYGDELAIRAFCHVHRKCVRVFSPEYTLTFGDAPDTINVAFDGTGHYDAVLPIARHQQATVFRAPAPPKPKDVSPKSPSPSQTANHSNMPSVESLLNVCIANTNGVSQPGRWEQILERCSHVTILTETHCTTIMQKALPLEARDFQIHWGASISPGARTGVAFLVKKGKAWNVGPLNFAGSPCAPFYHEGRLHAIQLFSADGTRSCLHMPSMAMQEPGGPKIRKMH